MKQHVQYGWREERQDKRRFWSVAVFAIWLGGLIVAAFVIWRDDDNMIYP